MRNRYAGYALVITLALLATASLAYIGMALRNAGNSADVRAQRTTLRALREAETALIGYAAMEDNTPGTLPCPSSGVDGKSSNVCTNATPLSLGRIPWHRLGMIAPRDGDGQCLWYALSLTHRNQPGYGQRGLSPDTPPINPGTIGDLTLQQNATVTSAVAVLLAAGLPVDGSQATQRASSGGSIDCDAGPVSAFFEAADTIDNDSDDTAFVDAAASASFNDRLRPIDQRKLLRPVLRRVLQALASAGMRNELVARMLGIGGSTGTLAELRALDGKQHAFDTLLLASAPDAGGACPTTGFTRHPVGWLCVNGWYDEIRFTQATQSLTVYLDSTIPTGYRCSMRLGDGTILCGSGATV